MNLKRDVLIHICADGTFTHRRRSEPVFNGAALPVYSVDTESEAEALMILTCSREYEEHPQLPGQVWYKISPTSGFEFDDVSTLTRVSDFLSEMHEKIRE